MITAETVSSIRHEMPEFVQQLPRPVRDRVAGTFSTEPGLAPLAEIREACVPSPSP
jgi:hypothetical protein